MMDRTLFERDLASQLLPRSAIACRTGTIAGIASVVRTVSEGMTVLLRHLRIYKVFILHSLPRSPLLCLFFNIF